MSALPLSGIKILDLTRVLAGPLSAQMLGDLGADVIKIERPGTGDDARAFGPPYLVDPAGKENNNNSFYLCANRNKRSVTVNVASAEGQEIILELAKGVDVFMENYKVGDLKRYGLDYESIKKVNPGIIYCSVTGFGQTGPYAPRAGLDPIFQAMSGLMSVTGHPDGKPGAGPMRVGVPITDFICGLYAYGAILTALHHRDRVSGEGQHIDLALLDSAISATCVAQVNYLSNGVVQPRQGNAAPTSAPSGQYDCADGPVTISTPNNDIFTRMCKALGRSDIAEDPRFTTNQERVNHRAELVALLEPEFVKWQRLPLMDLLEEHTVPCAPIYNINDVYTDPQVKHRVNSVEVAHPVTGRMAFGTNPVRLSATPVKDYTAPPGVGEHTVNILANVLKLDAARIDELRNKKIVN